MNLNPLSLPLLAVAGVSLGLAACGGDDGAELAFTMQQGAAGVPNALVLESSLDVTRLQIQLSEIKLLPEDKTGDEEKYKGKDTYTLDLLDAEKSTVPDFALEAGTYKKVEFKIDKPKDGAGIDGTDASVWLEAEKDGTKIRFLTANVMKIQLKDASGIEIGGAGDEDFLVDLRVVDWLANVDLAGLTAGTDGIAVIEDKGDNKAAHDRIKSNITTAIKLLRKKKK